MPLPGNRNPIGALRGVRSELLGKRAIGGVGFGGTAGDGTTINSFYSSGDKVKIESTTLRIAAIWEF